MLRNDFIKLVSCHQLCQKCHIYGTLYIKGVEPIESKEIIYNFIIFVRFCLCVRTINRHACDDDIQWIGVFGDSHRSVKCGPSIYIYL